jgi:hypothetical protein
MPFPGRGALSRNAPAAPSLSESEAAETDASLEEMLSIYPVLDLRAFDRVEAGDPSAVRLFATGPNAEAEGEATPEGFVVFSRSTARAEEVPSATASVTRLRAQLLAEGVIAGDGPQDPAKPSDGLEPSTPSDEV